MYVRVPAGSKLGPITVTIEVQWAHRSSRRQDDRRRVEERGAEPAWAVGRDRTDGLSIMVPSSAIASARRSAAVLDLWDRILDADADLAAIPHDRPRAERILVDRELSAGYMHSGYPIMAHLDVQGDLVSLASLKAGFWGPLHELGHNHQWDPWMLPGSTEASVNLWSVYASENALNIPHGSTVPDLDPAEPPSEVQDYLAGGGQFRG